MAVAQARASSAVIHGACEAGGSTVLSVRDDLFEMVDMVSVITLEQPPCETARTSVPTRASHEDAPGRGSGLAQCVYAQ